MRLNQTLYCEKSLGQLSGKRSKELGLNVGANKMVGLSRVKPKASTSKPASVLSNIGSSSQLEQIIIKIQLFDFIQAHLSPSINRTVIDVSA